MARQAALCLSGMHKPALPLFATSHDSSSHAPPPLPCLPPWHPSPFPLAAVVIGLQSTGEAAADSLGLQPGDQCGFISTTRQLLLHFVDTHFPTRLAMEEQQPEMQQGEDGWEQQQQGQGELGGGGGGSGDVSPGRQQQQGKGVQQLQQQGGGEEEPTSVQLKGTILQRIAELDLPPNFLDEVRWRQQGSEPPASLAASRLPAWQLPGMPASQDMAC